MMRSLLIVVLGLLPLRVFAEENTVEAPTAPMIQTQPAPTKDKAPIAAINFGYIYIGSETAPGTWNWHLHGFFGIPQVNVNHWLGFIGDFTQSYNTSAGAHENVQSILAGPIFTAKSKAKISPFAFADAGRIRDSMDGMVTNSPCYAVGGGFQFKVNKHLGLLLVPAEYIQRWPPTGANTLNSFTARFGITLPLYK